MGVLISLDTTRESQDGGQTFGFIFLRVKIWILVWFRKNILTDDRRTIDRIHRHEFWWGVGPTRTQLSADGCLTKKIYLFGLGVGSTGIFELTGFQA